MTTEQFEAKQAAMSNEELIKLAYEQVHELARSGGRSHQMSIPPTVTDTDMILSELIKRFEKLVDPCRVGVRSELAALKKGYEQLLRDEHEELVRFASAHGWKSTRAELGQELRDRIEILSKV